MSTSRSTYVRVPQGKPPIAQADDKYDEGITDEPIMGSSGVRQHSFKTSPRVLARNPDDDNDDEEKMPRRTPTGINTNPSVTRMGFSYLVGYYASLPSDEKIRALVEFIREREHAIEGDPDTRRDAVVDIRGEMLARFPDEFAVWKSVFNWSMPYVSVSRNKVGVCVCVCVCVTVITNMILPVLQTSVNREADVRVDVAAFIHRTARIGKTRIAINNKEDFTNELDRIKFRLGDDDAFIKVERMFDAVRCTCASVHIVACNEGSHTQIIHGLPVRKDYWVLPRSAVAFAIDVGVELVYDGIEPRRRRPISVSLAAARKEFQGCEQFMGVRLDDRPALQRAAALVRDRDMGVVFAMFGQVMRVELEVSVMIQHM